ncbi:MAG: FecR family protein [Holophagae bacterium]|jgi:hypothetical protein
MSRAILIALLAASVPVVGVDTPGTVPITYEVVAVDGRLFLELESEPRRLNPGDRPVSGDRLRTGSSSAATLGVPSYTTVFRLDSKTTCTLAHDRPGVLLHVERGRLRAMFGSYSGTDPRIVTTPSAVLAVRGTDYGLKVKKNGDTRLVVFDGVVEAIDPTGTRPPVRVEAGQQTRIRPGRTAETPEPHRLTPNEWNRGFDAPAPGTGPDGGAPGGQSGSPGAGQRSGGGSKRRGG